MSCGPLMIDTFVYAARRRLGGSGEGSRLAFGGTTSVVRVKDIRPTETKHILFPQSYKRYKRLARPQLSWSTCLRARSEH